MIKDDKDEENSFWKAACELVDAECCKAELEHSKSMFGYSPFPLLFTNPLFYVAADP